MTKMRKMKLWMKTAILTSAAMLTSCVDKIDNPVVKPEAQGTETEAQVKFWEKFKQWETDSCTVGDDFYMHYVGKFWWNPHTIYEKGMMAMAESEATERAVAVATAGDDADVRALNGLTYGNLTNMGKATDEEVDKMVDARLSELWQNATTMEQAMEALGRFTVAGYNNFFEPIVKVVEGQPAWVIDIPYPFYYDFRDLMSILSKKEIQHHLAYRGGKPLRRAEIAVDDNMKALFKGMNLGVTADQINWENGAVNNYHLLVNALKTPDDVKSWIREKIKVYDGLLISDKMRVEYVSAGQISKEGKKILPLSYESLCNFIQFRMGQLYIMRAHNKKYVTAAMKKQYGEWCEEYRLAMQKRMENSPWLSAETRNNALEKLKAIEFYIAVEPDEIPAVAVPKLRTDNLVAMVRQLRQARHDTYRWLIGRTRRDAMMLCSYESFLYDYMEDNGSYSPGDNCVFINASNLLPPYIQEGDEETLRQAITASCIGHELTHAFDSSGRHYDKYGSAKDWWLPADTLKFNNFCDQLEKNYSDLLMMPWASKTLYNNGKGTLAENIADIGGCCLGLDILLSKHQDAKPEERQQLIRRYFQSWAIAWCGNYDLESAQYRYNHDEHSQLRERTNGVVRNIDAWYDAYDIKSGTLYLEPSKRVAIW